MVSSSYTEVIAEELKVPHEQWERRCAAIASRELDRWALPERESVVARRTVCRSPRRRVWLDSRIEGTGAQPLAQGFRIGVD
jgi:hypothetical protein